MVFAVRKAYRNSKSSDWSGFVLHALRTLRSSKVLVSTHRTFSSQPITTFKWLQQDQTGVETGQRSARIKGNYSITTGTLVVGTYACKSGGSAEERSAESQTSKKFD